LILSLLSTYPGKVVSVGTPVLKEENSEFFARQVEVDFLIDLKAWEPLDEDHYSAGDTFDFFSASPKLPDAWEVIETSIVWAV
jgi:hypothetical protein